MTTHPAVAVDMDGTLVDSEKLWDIAVRDISREMGREVDGSTRKRTLGASMRTFFAILSEYTGHTVDTEKEFQRLRARLTERVAELFATQLRWRDGSRELLDSLAESGVDVVLVTNTESELAALPIAFMGASRFRAVITGDSVANPKPAPDPYLAAAQALGRAADDCLAIEDSVTGATAAVAAGCRVLYVPSTAGQPDIPGTVRRDSLEGLDLAGLCAALSVGQ